MKSFWATRFVGGMLVWLLTASVPAAAWADGGQPYVPIVGSCTGPGWNQGGWPRAQGSLTAPQCQERCDLTRGCTSFELSRARGDRFECTLFGHSGVTGEGSADTCFSNAPLGSYVALKGSCRGLGWNEGGWPRAQGYRTLGEAIAACAGTPGCTAFDLARPRDGRFDVFLFGHSGVQGDGSDDQCFASRVTAVAGVRPSTPVPPPAAAFDPATVIRATGTTCPANYRHVTVAEAQADRARLCSKLGAWDIARLGDGASMDGSGYGCKIAPTDSRSLGHSLCTPAPASPCAVVRGTQCYWLENETGNSCWVPAGTLAPDFNSCFRADSCNGGGGASGGGCYKWSNGSTGPRTPWPAR